MTQAEAGYGAHRECCCSDDQGSVHDGVAGIGRLPAPDGQAAPLFPSHFFSLMHNRIGMRALF